MGNGILKVGIIGCGGIAYASHIPWYKKSPNAEIVALCDVDKQKLKKVAKCFEISGIYNDYKELLKRDDIDSVDVCTSSYTHFQIVVDACKAGKHVLCQKPMANSIDEAKTMVNAARENNVKLGIIYMFRFRNEYLHLKMYVANGQLGQITTIRGRMAHAGGLGIKPEDWRYSFRKGGGSFSLLGVHHVDLFRWLNGPVKRVCAISKTLKCNMQGDDTMAAILEFENGVVGVIDTGYTVTAPGNTLVEVYGDKGAVLINQSDKSFQLYIDKNSENKIPYTEQKENKKWQKYNIDKLKKLSKFDNYIKHWIDCIINDKEPVTPGEEGMASLEIVLAAYESAATGKWVELKHQNRK